MTVAVMATSSLRLADMVIPDHLSRDLRRAEEFIQLAVLAAQQALAAAPGVDGQRTGIYLGTAFGPMQCNLDVLHDLVMAEPISPTLFSHSVFNAAAGYISRICQIYGPALTLNSYGWPFFCALQSGWDAITDHSLDQALVLQVETYSSLLDETRTALLPNPAPTWPAGVAAWLLGRQGSCRLDHITVIEEPCRPEARLARYESSADDDGCHPLAAVEELTGLIKSGQITQTWQREADYGRVELRFSQGEE